MPIVKLPSRATAQFASFGSVLISSFNASPTVADLELLHHHQTALVKLYGHVSGLSLVYCEGIGHISEEIKRHTVEVTQAIGPRCLGTATVVLGDGLTAALVRTCLSGLCLLANAPYDITVAPTVEAALEWLVARPGQMINTRRLKAEDVLRHFSVGVAVAKAA